jgi:hypothetical protein
MGQFGQQRVETLKEAEKIIARDNGKYNLYISHNSFPGLWESIRDAQYVRIHQMFYDFDHKEKLENPLHDLRVLLDWHRENNLSCRVNFSGSKGFHLYTDLNPAVYNLNEKIPVTVNKTAEMNDYYKSLQITLKKDLNLRTLDLRCAEPLRICRISNSMHMKSKLYCIPLTYNEVNSLTTKEIKEMAKHPAPGLGLYENYRKQSDILLKFHEFVEEFDIDPHIQKASYSGVDNIRFAEWKEGEGEKWKWMQSVMPPKYPCIINDMYHSSNPTHMARFASAVHWKRMSEFAPMITDENGKKKRIAPTPKWVNDFYLKMEYDDVHNNQEREDNINSIWTHSYKAPTCRTLYESEICIGSECEKFHKFLKNVDGKKVKK